MLLDNIIDIVQRDENGGIRTEENRWDELYVISIINIVRADLAKVIYNGNRQLAANDRLNPKWYQKVWLEFDEQLQDDPCCIKFKSIAPLSVSKQNDGFRFVGTQEGSQEFSRLRNRSYLAQVRSQKFMLQVLKSETAALYDGFLNTWEIYTNLLLEKLMVEGLFADPLAVPSYSREEDDYPIPDDNLPMLFDLVRARLYPVTAKMADNTDDGKESGVPQQIKR